MFEFADKQVLVAGSGRCARAACALLVRRGARVSACRRPGDLREAEAAHEPQPEGVRTLRSEADCLAGGFDLAVLGPEVPARQDWVQELHRRRTPVIGELELGFRQSLCLNLAVAGTNGRTSAARLIERVLLASGRKALRAGGAEAPVCEVVDRTRELDFLILEVSPFALEGVEFFRPAVGVLLNTVPAWLDRYPTLADQARTQARLFANQQPFDWAIVQSEALALLRSHGLDPTSKTITFSASNRRADLYLDRGLILSRLPDWTGPLLDLDKCRLRGPHQAENLMAALAVGHVLRVPLPQMAEALKAETPAAHCCEPVADLAGARFVDDARAANLGATMQALRAVPAGRGGEPNVLLIAGGRDDLQEFHDLGPLLSQRVKRAFLFGSAAPRLRAAWSLFTPCTPVTSLLEAVERTAESAVPGDVVLLSPACSDLELFPNPEACGGLFRELVQRIGASPDRLEAEGPPGRGPGHSLLKPLHVPEKRGPTLPGVAAPDSETHPPSESSDPQSGRKPTTL